MEGFLGCNHEKERTCLDAMGHLDHETDARQREGEMEEGEIEL